MFFYDNSTFRTVKLATESDFEDILLGLQSQIFPNFFLFETKNLLLPLWRENSCRHVFGFKDM